MEVSKLKYVTLNTELSPFYIARDPGYKFLLEGLICSLRVNIIVLDRWTSACSMLILRCSARGSHPGYWKPPGTEVDYDDKNLREASKREVEKKTGISEIKFIDNVPIKTWNTLKGERVRDWFDFTILTTVNGQSNLKKNIHLAQEEHQN
ncbi:hypothetical protein BBP40_012225 [Aspergillus hancockii]|nr:hypothetical protein BBP40_012225 [Aspergillus hancockii]